MNIENNKTPKHQIAEDACSVSATAQDTLERGAEVYAQAEQSVSDIYDKTAQAANETYKKAKNYSNGNPGKTILVAVGIGVGLGLLLGASSHRSRTDRFAQPVINALSGIARAFFR